MFEFLFGKKDSSVAASGHGASSVNRQRRRDTERRVGMLLDQVGRQEDCA
jgi:hypothetical protein